MSLQVWLPLNGNLNNNGVADAVITNSNATVDANGKIGSCYRFNKNAYMSINKEVVNTITSGECSFCLWLKINSFNAAWDTYVQFGLGTTPWVAYTMGLLRNGSSSNLVFAISNGSTSSQTSYTTPNVTFGQWFHIACVYKPGHCLIYINGTLYADNTTSLVPNFSAVTAISLGGLSGTYKTDTYINDFRIYDHALSAKEVKEISKGLILHMPLDNNGAGCNNILPNTSAIEVRYNYPTNTSTYQDQFAAVTSVVPSGSQYCLSFFAKSTVNGDKIRAHYYSPNTTTRAESNQGIVSTASDGNIDITLSTEWKQYYIVYTQSSTTAVKHVILPRMFGSAREEAAKGSGTVSIRCLKLEEGNKPTPWCPNTADALYSSLGFNSSTVYDTSGYANNGTMSSTKPTTVSDAPRYSSSMLFANGTYISTTLPSVTGFANSYTFSWWGKCTAYESRMYWGFSGGNRLNLYGTGGIYCWNTGDGANNKFGTVAIAGQADNNWHHFAVTGDGTTTKLYIDGVFKANATTYKGITGNTLIFNGWDTGNSYNFNGQLSDFRLYATCLSAEDISELYKVSASVDNTGKTFAMDYAEI